MAALQAELDGLTRDNKELCKEVEQVRFLGAVSNHLGAVSGCLLVYFAGGLVLKAGGWK